MLIRNEVIEKLKQIFISGQYIRCDLEIDENMSLLNDLEIDSLTFIQIICDIEKIFDIYVEEEDLNFDSNFKIIDLCNLIERLKIR